MRLNPDARYVMLRLTEKKQSVSEVRLYSQGQLPAYVQSWYAPLSKCDLLVVAAHQGDEFGCFGGMIPYYAQVENRLVQVAYMTSGDREDCQESLNALWTAGIVNHPQFLGYKDSKTSSLKKAVSQWGGKDDLVGDMVELIRRLQPEVIVTHAYDGENGDFQHAATAQALAYAVEAAGNATAYNQSARAYGTWNVKKLYLHLGDENVLEMDWTTPNEELGGLSPLDAALAAYTAYHDKSESGRQGEDGRFSLLLSSVGEDVNGSGIFENTALDSQPEEAPADEDDPEAQVAATPAIQFAPEATPASASNPGSAEEFSNASLKIILIVGACIAVMLLISISQVVLYRVLKDKRTKFY